MGCRHRRGIRVIRGIHPKRWFGRRRLRGIGSGIVSKRQCRRGIRARSVHPEWSCRRVSWWDPSRKVVTSSWHPWHPIQTRVFVVSFVLVPKGINVVVGSVVPIPKDRAIVVVSLLAKSEAQSTRGEAAAAAVAWDAWVWIDSRFAPV